MENDWTPKPGQENVLKNIPRLLTEQQIDRILEGFPDPKSGDDDARDMSKDLLLKRLRFMLRTVVLDPSAIDEYKTRLHARYISSQIQEGENIGVNGANALGETVSQIALNTFHFSGSAGVMVNNISSLRNLLFGYRIKNGRHSIIMPKERFNSFDEILKLRKELEGLSIGDLLISKDMEVRKMKDHKIEPWVDAFVKLRGVSYDPRTYAMKVKVNINKMLIYEIKMEQLSRMIKQGNPGINIIYSPLSKRTLYILSIGDENVLKGTFRSYQMMYYFRDAFIPRLSKIFIKGVPSIEKIYPISAAVWERSTRNTYREYLRENLPNEVPKNFKRRKGPYWIVELNQSRMYEFKLNDPSDNLFEQLLNSLFLEYIHVEKDNKYVIYNPYYTVDINDFVRERKNGLPYLANVETIISKREPSSFELQDPIIIKIGEENCIFPRNYILETTSFRNELKEFKPGDIITRNVEVNCYSLIVERRTNLENENDPTVLEENEYKQRVANCISYLLGAGEAYFKLITIDGRYYVVHLKKGHRDKELKKRGIKIDYHDKTFTVMSVKGFKIGHNLPKLKNKLLPKKSICFSDIDDDSLKKMPFSIDIIDHIKPQKEIPDFGGHYLLISKKDQEFKPDLKNDIAEYVNFNKGYSVYIASEITVYKYLDDDGNVKYSKEKRDKLDEFTAVPIKDGATPYHPIDLINEEVKKRYNTSFMLEIEKSFYLFDRRGVIDEELEKHLLQMGIKFNYDDSVGYYFYLNEKEEVVYSENDPKVDSYKLYGFKMEGNIRDNDEEKLKDIVKRIKDKTKADPYEKWYILSKDKNITDTSKKESSNLDDYAIFANKHVDPLRSYSNSTHSIRNILGVEASCYFLINAIKQSVMASGNYIDPRHILLISDFIFNRGEVYGVIYSGLSRQPVGHLTASTFERGMEVLKKYAPGGGKEPIGNVSSSIATGQYIKTGTGLFNIKSVELTKEEMEANFLELPVDIRRQITEAELEKALSCTDDDGSYDQYGDILPPRKKQRDIEDEKKLGIEVLFGQITAELKALNLTLPKCISELPLSAEQIFTDDKEKKSLPIKPMRKLPPELDKILSGSLKREEYLELREQDIIKTKNKNNQKACVVVNKIEKEREEKKKYLLSIKEEIVQINIIDLVAYIKQNF